MLALFIIKRIRVVKMQHQTFEHYILSFLFTGITFWGIVLAIGAVTSFGGIFLIIHRILKTPHSHDVSFNFPFYRVKNLEKWMAKQCVFKTLGTIKVRHRNFIFKKHNSFEKSIPNHVRSGRFYHGNICHFFESITFWI